MKIDTTPVRFGYPNCRIVSNAITEPKRPSWRQAFPRKTWWAIGIVGGIPLAIIAGVYAAGFLADAVLAWLGQ